MSDTTHNDSGRASRPPVPPAGYQHPVADDDGQANGAAQGQAAPQAQPVGGQQQGAGQPQGGQASGQPRQQTPQQPFGSGQQRQPGPQHARFPQQGQGNGGSGPNGQGQGPFNPFSPMGQGGNGNGGKLTGGQKAMWLVLGILLDVFSIPLVFLIYMGRDPKQRSEALRWTLIGVCIVIVLYMAVYATVDPQLFQQTAASGFGASQGSSGWTSSTF